MNTDRKSGGVECGFTLVELIIVIAIIGVLATVTVLSIGGDNKGKAAGAVVRANVRSVVTVITTLSANTSYTTAGTCAEGKVVSTLGSFFGGIDDSFVAGTHSIDDDNSGLSGAAGIGGNVDVYMLGVANGTVGAVGDGELVTAAVADGGTALGASTNAAAGADGEVEARYGCASNSAGWVVWGAVDDGKYYCVDSRGSTGDSALTVPPNNYADIYVAANPDQTRCGDGTAGIGG